MRYLRPTGAVWLLGLLGICSGISSYAQPPYVPGKTDVEVLTRGPVHEAYALPSGQQAAPGAFAPKTPPALIDELPPDQKPEGDDVRWISGYWSYDEERKDFVWISGFWRVPPPGRGWVPGDWRETAGGWQWVGGFWGPVAESAQPGTATQAELEYLPEPPPSIEAGPSTPAPSAESVYLPGTWVHRERYFWQPGCWTDNQPGWVWTPASYRWTAAGYVFVDGFWDRPLEDRGVLFPPVAFAPEVYAAPGYAYTPSFAIQEQALFGSLFVGRGRGSYFFGDYFDQQYINAGYTPWCAGYGFGGGGRGFGFEVGFQRSFRDPLFDYYRSSRRDDPYWGGGGIGQLYAGRYQGNIGRPPRTLIQQNVLVNNITNNTVVNNTTINNVKVVAPFRAGQSAGNRAFTPIAPDVRTRYAGDAQASRAVAKQRTLVETQFAARGPRPTAGVADQRRTALTLPVQTAARTPGAKNSGSSTARVVPPPPQIARPAAKPGTTGIPTPPRSATPTAPQARSPQSPTRPQAAAGPQPGRPPAPRTNPPAASPPRPAATQPQTSPRSGPQQQIPPRPMSQQPTAPRSVPQQQAVPKAMPQQPTPPRPQQKVPPRTFPQQRAAPRPVPQQQSVPKAMPQQPTPPRPAPQQQAPPRAMPQQPSPPRPAPQQQAPPRTFPQQPSAPRPAPQQQAPPRTFPQQPAPPRAVPQQQAPPRAMPQPAARPVPQQQAPPRAVPQQPSPPRSAPQQPAPPKVIPQQPAPPRAVPQLPPRKKDKK